MKLRLEIEGHNYLLDWQPQQDSVQYRVTGDTEAGGVASVEQIAPGVFSILHNRRSLLVRIAETPHGLEAFTGNGRLRLSIADPRDWSGAAKQASAAGPQEVRALMPGKIIKLLVPLHGEVEVGTGVVVVEAMKMQNEMKAPKTGKVVKIHVVEGSTVAPGEPLLTIE
jgi:biotin carboxyl carrier protein